MNRISVFGKTMSKEDFFDYCFDVHVNADWEEPGHPLYLEDKILSDIRRSLGWEEEYRQWVYRDMEKALDVTEFLTQIEAERNASPTA